jgi:hypothetical protein
MANVTLFHDIITEYNKNARAGVMTLTSNLADCSDKWASKDRRVTTKEFMRAWEKVTGETIAKGYCSLLLNFAETSVDARMRKAITSVDVAGIAQTTVMHMAVAMPGAPQAFKLYCRILKREKFPARKVASFLARLKELEAAKSKEEERKSRTLKELGEPEVMEAIALVLTPRAATEAETDEPEAEEAGTDWKLLYGRAAELLYMFGLKVDAETLGDDTRYTEVRNAVKKVIDDKASKVAKAS